MPSGVSKPAGPDEPSEAKDSKDFASDLAKVAGLTHEDAVKNPKGIKAMVERMSKSVDRGAARRGGGGKKGK